MLRTSTNENTPLGYDEMKTKPKSIFKGKVEKI
jgi:hypothetical protein